MNELLELYMTMGISPAVYNYGETAITQLKERFDKIDKIAEHNQAKVIAAMQKNKVSAACFAATTGYGYDDMGRDTLEKVYADVFHTEAALVRPPDHLRHPRVDSCTLCKSPSRRRTALPCRPSL